MWFVVLSQPHCMVLAQVHKFGGTCVSAPERILEAARLVASQPAQQRLVVVSAMGSHPSSPVKVTDLLLNMIAKASNQDQAFLIDLAALQVFPASRRDLEGFKLLCTTTQFIWHQGTEGLQNLHHPSGTTAWHRFHMQRFMCPRRLKVCIGGAALFAEHLLAAPGHKVVVMAQLSIGVYLQGIVALGREYANAAGGFSLEEAVDVGQHVLA